MNHPLSYSFTYTILSIYVIGKISPRIFACSACSAVRKKVNQQIKKMLNEPNSNVVCPEFVEGFAQSTSSIKYPESRIEQKMSNEPNLRYY